jgi:outer membrane protein OmpA-like peptidoglycan-associated protein/tetratricopeptide (TPR) repeat protein
MKSFLLVIQILIFTACSSVAQMQYSSTNKKAISLFEDAMAAANSMNEQTGYPNYPLGIELLNKALEKDPKFTEAYLVLAEFYQTMKKHKEAITAYEAAIALNPHHSATGSTFFYIATSQTAVGDYDAAIKNLDYYISNRNANPEMVNQASAMKRNCEFASNALKNPSQFTPINMGPGINTPDPEYFPTITVDGKTILFTRRIDDERVPVYKEQEDFYVSQLSDRNIWGTAVPMPPNVNSILNEGAPTISADGKSLIFVACSGQSNDMDYGEARTGKGSCDLFYTKKLGKAWSNPVNIPGNVNSFSWESQPSLSADGKTLYFIRRVSKRGEANDTDIFVVKLKENGTWGTPERLSNSVNTPAAEESVLIHPDGKSLYFASRGHYGMGGSDLFVSRLDENGSWSKPVNLGYPINTASDENSLMVSPDGEIGFFASDRAGGYGELDIYWFNMPENMRPTKTLYFEGKVFDITNNKPLAGKFRLIDLKTGKEVIYSEADNVNGEFMVSLPINCDYALNVSYPGYNFFSQNFNMTNPEGLEAIHMDVPMIPVTSDVPTILKNVFFDLASANLRPTSFVELNKLRDFLIINATIKIELGGHTDTRGDATENQVLSNNRAKAVYDYLVKEGIVATRLSYKGYGETVNINSDAAISKLGSEKEKEAAHQENRRTEYKIIK